jgi:outer membrane protein assembly factor BamB
VPISQVLAAEDRFYVSRTKGINEMYLLSEPTTPATSGATRALSYGPHVTLYGGLLLKCGWEGKLHCIDPATGRGLWSTQVGDRLTGCPVAIGEDVFIAGDTGRLLKLDLANGSTMMEAALSGGVAGSLATDGKRLYAITEDGTVQCLDTEGGQVVWKVPVAKYTDSTPAVDGGVVYLADREGLAQALGAGDGAVRWTAKLDQEFTRCPVVTDRHVIFGCRGGRLAILNRADGKAVRTVQVNSRFDYEPLVLGDKLLYFEGPAGKCMDLASGAVTDFIVRRKTVDPVTHKPVSAPGPLLLPDDPMVSISYYQGRLIILPRNGDRAHERFGTADVWYPATATYYLVSPYVEPPPPPPEPAGKKDKK